MYRERGYCTHCHTTLYREEWRKPKLTPVSEWWREREDTPTVPPPAIEIEYFYKYFDEWGNEVTECPRCSRFIGGSHNE